MKKKRSMTKLIATVCFLFIGAVVIADFGSLYPEACKKKNCPHFEN